MLVLTQASVGIGCVLSAAIVFDLWPLLSVQAASVSATIIGFVGVQAALLHLGRPWLAYRSVLGWRRSWLSREAIAFGVYLGATLAASASCLLNSLHFLAPAACMTAAAVGCVAVFCSAMIYIATQRELWSATRTGLEFSSTTLGLGLGISSLFVGGMSAVTLLVGSIACCVVSLIPKLIDWRAASQIELSWNSFSGRSGRLLRRELRSIFGLAIACLLAAGCFTAASSLLSGTSVKYALMVSAVVTLVASQLLTRWLYFASVVFARMPGAST